MLTSYNPPLSVEVLSEAFEQDDLMAFWRAQTRHSNSDPEFFFKVIALRNNVVSPLIVLVRENGVPVTALICRLETKRLRARIGYFTLASFPVRSISVIYGGIIGMDTDDTRSECLGALLRELRTGTADVVEFSMISANSAFAGAIESLGLAKWRLKASVPREHFVLRVPGAADDILLAKPPKRRKKIKYYMRKAENNLRNLQVNRSTSEDDLDRLMVDLESVASKTYQRGLGVGFYNNEEWRELLRLGFRKNWLDVWTLSTECRCVSFIIGLKYKGRYLIYAKAFDPAYSNDCVGTYLQIKVLEAVARQGECTVVDYGFGEADYKRQFSTENWSEVDLLIARTSVRSFVVMNVIRTCAATDRILRALSETLGVTRRVKKLLRSRKSRAAQGGVE